METLWSILRLWCAAYTAKFNEHKTVLLPFGRSSYRQKVIGERRINSHSPIGDIDPTIKIVASEAVLSELVRDTDDMDLDSEGGKVNADGEEESTSLGLAFERVDDKPRAFGNETLAGVSQAVLAFLKARPRAEQWIRYVRSVLDEVAQALRHVELFFLDGIRPRMAT
ncbi:hypothetical protein B0H10DRAFT_2235741 [Mycena sp. CBHHK59/15]|nr:hypothetical protein B0H10DRAFT_2235741 [Mycena sp. CBHHK59/15]